jgi:hypothetical protein
MSRGHGRLSDVGIIAYFFPSGLPLALEKPFSEASIYGVQIDQSILGSAHN